jgi:hypothetical protein
MALHKVVTPFVCIFMFVTHLFIDASEHRNTVTPAKSYINYVSVLSSNDKTENSNSPVSKQDKNEKSLKRPLRYSKRFQSQSKILPNRPSFLYNILDRFLDIISIGKPTAYLLFSLILARSLRGPPVLS